MSDRLSYALVTPVRTEEENLARLAASVASQTLPPTRWVVVDNGSEDATLVVAREFARSRDWVKVISGSRADRTRVPRGPP